MNGLIQESRVPVFLAGIVLTMLALMFTFYQALRDDDASLIELTAQISKSDANFDKAVLLLEKAERPEPRPRRA